MRKRLIIYTIYTIYTIYILYIYYIYEEDMRRKYNLGVPEKMAAAAAERAEADAAAAIRAAERMARYPLRPEQFEEDIRRRYNLGVPEKMAAAAAKKAEADAAAAIRAAEGTTTNTTNTTSQASVPSLASSLAATRRARMYERFSIQPINQGGIVKRKKYRRRNKRKTKHYKKKAKCYTKNVIGVIRVFIYFDYL